MEMGVRDQPRLAWLLLTFSLPTKRASQRVEAWRKLQRYATVPLGNSGYLLPRDPMNEERFQWLATSIRKYGGDASIVHVQGFDNISAPQLIGRFAEARAREYQELICHLQKFSEIPQPKRALGRLSRLRSRFQEIVGVDFFSSPLQKRVEPLRLWTAARQEIAAVICVVAIGKAGQARVQQQLNIFPTLPTKDIHPTR